MKKRFAMMVVLVTALLLGMLLPISNVTVEAASMKLSSKKVTLTEGKTKKLSVKNLPSTSTVKWSTSDKKVTTVSSKGKVTAKKAGKATITATITAKSGKQSKLTCKITVKGKVNEDVSEYEVIKDQNTNTEADKAVKSIMIYTNYSELFFNRNSFDSMGPGLILVTYNADNRIVGNIKLAFSYTFPHAEGEIMFDEEITAGIYEKLTRTDNLYATSVENVRYEGKCVLADGIERYISNHIGHFHFNNYEEALNDCNTNEYIKKYSEGVYINSDKTMRVFFYDDVHEMDLTEFERWYD